MRTRAQAGTLVILFALGLGSARAARAQLDYSAGAAARSLPFGAAVAGEAGYGVRLWGDDPVWFGYLRPYARAQTSAVVNRVEAGLELNPVSFFNLTVAQAYTRRDTELDTLDCARLECRGGLARSIAAARLLLGGRGYFVSPTLRFEHFTAGTRDFGEEISNLEGHAGSDRLLEGVVFAGRKFESDLTLGLYLDSAHMLRSDHDNFTAMLFARQGFAPWALTVSAGSYRSSTQSPAFTAALALSWVGRKAIGLF